MTVTQQQEAFRSLMLLVLLCVDQLQPVPVNLKHLNVCCARTGGGGGGGGVVLEKRALERLFGSGVGNLNNPNFKSPGDIEGLVLIGIFQGI